MRGRWRIGLPLVSFALLSAGAYVGLAVVPRELYMGDVYRIMFVHVPTAWAGMLAFFVTFLASVWYLFSGSARADALASATAEVGLLFSTLLLLTGALWGRATWGVWWSWDPRLTTAVVMWAAFAGYVALRRFIHRPERRATWSAAVATIVSVDLPIVFFAVNWGTGLHPIRSSSSTMAPAMREALLLNAGGFVVTAAWLARLRYAIARARQAAEHARAPAETPVR